MRCFGYSFSPYLHRGHENRAKGKPQPYLNHVTIMLIPEYLEKMCIMTSA